MKLELAGRLRALPNPGAGEVAAVELATNGMDGQPTYRSDHIGRTVALRYHGTLIAGPLESVTDSLDETSIILRIGDFITVAVHPTHPVTVAPEGYTLSVIAETNTEEADQ
ncbi:hypothetical protein G4X40_18630 [Rhodococcus sp. D2-41]|uniref:hypothetical protein n=1 Tax=Speluncibacter jeojiensis TaxID=2710754 RepID=UPI00240F9F65|nr:hypothetical protein [Rhodococcus sp. D2-41]MDG3012162.1 hypothetical protein [Rhodococcus sp. D2-41]